MLIKSNLWRKGVVIKKRSRVNSTERAGASFQKEGGDNVLDEVLIIENIGRNMLAKRHQMNWTQARASEECDLSERAYGEIERGNTNPTIITLVKFC